MRTQEPEEKLDKMIAGAIRAGIRIYSRWNTDPLASEIVAEIVRLIQVAYDDINYWDCINALAALANGEENSSDYTRIFLKEVEKEK